MRYCFIFPALLCLVQLVVASMDKNQQDQYNSSPEMKLLGGSFLGRADMVRQLLRGGSDPNIVDPNTGNSPLILASHKGFDLVVDLLLDAGADVELSNTLGDKLPLMVAAYAGHVTVLQLLIEVGGAHIDASNTRGDTALSLACFNGHRDAAKYLLTVTPPAWSDPSFDASAQKGNENENNNLLHEVSSGANIYVLSKSKNYSPLYMAASQGHFNIVLDLLQHQRKYPPVAKRKDNKSNKKSKKKKGKAKKSDEKGSTNTTIAAENLHGVKDAVLGRTPLMVAAAEGHVEVIRLLLADTLRAEVSLEDLQIDEDEEDAVFFDGIGDEKKNINDVISVSLGESDSEGTSQKLSKHNPMQKHTQGSTEKQVKESDEDPNPPSKTRDPGSVKKSDEKERKFLQRAQAKAKANNVGYSSTNANGGNKGAKSTAGEPSNQYYQYNLDDVDAHGASVVLIAINSNGKCTLNCISSLFAYVEAIQEYKISTKRGGEESEQFDQFDEPSAPANLLDLEIRDPRHNGQTALLRAVALGLVDIVEYLLLKDANVFALDDSGRNILTIAKGSGSADSKCNTQECIGIIRSFMECVSE